MVNQVRYLYEAEMGTKKAKNIKEVKKMLGRRTKSHQNMLKDQVRAPKLIYTSSSHDLFRMQQITLFVSEPHSL